jgi:FAD/FMN-containing dehydrogenase
LTTSTSWGRLEFPDTQTVDFIENETNLSEFGSTRKFIPIGNGRSYGDVGLNPDGIGLSTSRLNTIISFDERTGQLECESGVLIRDIQRIFSKRGWMVPVTPGTSFVSVGGAIANDVHGKNHHRVGSFGNHVIDFVLARTDQEILECSTSKNSYMYYATIGGLGLTGLILKARIQLKRIPSAWIRRETAIFSNIAEFDQLSKSSEFEFESSVAWFDCATKKAGRGSFVRGNHIEIERPTPEPSTTRLNMPITPPFSVINPLTLKVLNAFYFQYQKAAKSENIESMWKFYYPLDGIQNWNRAYGKKGFYQYQCVVPTTIGVQSIEEILKVIKSSGSGSFLAVLKTFGIIPSVGILSFPMPGITLALDFPNFGEKTTRLFRTLDNIVLQAGGRVNPSKDALMSAEVFQASYPRISEFEKYRDPGISSGFSRRVMGW